jgi:hypothetical protein
MGAGTSAASIEATPELRDVVAAGCEASDSAAIYASAGDAFGREFSVRFAWRRAPQDRLYAGQGCGRSRALVAKCGPWLRTLGSRYAAICRFGGQDHELSPSSPAMSRRAIIRRSTVTCIFAKMLDGRSGSDSGAHVPRQPAAASRCGRQQLPIGSELPSPEGSGHDAHGR